MVRALVGLCIVLAASSAAAEQRTNPARERAHEQAAKHFKKGEFKRAAEAFDKELALLFDAERGTPIELAAREKLVLALYAAGDAERAYKEYQALVAVFAEHRFDEDSVLPDTARDLEAHVTRKAIVVAPVSLPASEPASQPRVLVEAPKPEAKRWHWYYLAPLGIGQYLAGSPVRGTIFLVLQAGLIATNIVTAVMLGSLLNKDGTSPDPARATMLQIAMNVGFFGAIGSGVAGLVDGAFFEP